MDGDEWPVRLRFLAFVQGGALAAQDLLDRVSAMLAKLIQRVANQHLGRRPFRVSVAVTVTAYVTDGRARARGRSPCRYGVRIETSAEHI